MVGIPFVVVTSYMLYQRGMSLIVLYRVCLVLIKPVVLEQEQKPIIIPAEGSMTARNGSQTASP